MAIATSTRTAAAASHHRPAGAWSRPPDGDAAPRKTLIPAHDGDRQPVAPAHPGPGSPRDRQQRQVAEDEQQLNREDRLYQGQRAEPQGAHLEPETGDHAGQAHQPGGLPSQPEDQPGVEAASFGGGPLQVARAETLADRGGGGTEARCQ
jgi:hypothetical protein